MPTLPKLDPLDIASLLASKICHDVVSPVGAIVNALETIEDDDSGDMAEFAQNIVSQSAEVASAKLAFARTAFGASGGATTPIDSGLAQEVAEGYFAHEKAELSWTGPRSMMPKDRAKLLLNLVYQSTQAVPRGGTVQVNVDGEGDAATFTLRCEGPRARVPDTLLSLMNEAHEGPVTAREIQPWFTLKLAEASGMEVSARADEETVILAAA